MIYVNFSFNGKHMKELLSFCVLLACKGWSLSLQIPGGNSKQLSKLVPYWAF